MQLPWHYQWGSSVVQHKVLSIQIHIFTSDTIFAECLSRVSDFKPYGKSCSKAYVISANTNFKTCILDKLDRLQSLWIMKVLGRLIQSQDAFFICRSPSLQSLAISQPRCTGDQGGKTEHLSNLSKLRSLSLTSTLLPKKWFELAFQFLPNLTSLNLQGCKYAGPKAYLGAETRVFNLEYGTFMALQIRPLLCRAEACQLNDAFLLQLL